jgi:hypothetical protein
LFKNNDELDIMNYMQSIEINVEIIP